MYQGGAGISLQGGGWNNSTSGDLATKGADRRLVTVPVVDCTEWAASNPQQVPVLGYACVPMLHPMQWLDAGGSEEVWLEFRGASTIPAARATRPGSRAARSGQWSRSWFIEDDCGVRSNNAAWPWSSWASRSS